MRKERMRNAIDIDGLVRDFAASPRARQLRQAVAAQQCPAPEALAAFCRGVVEDQQALQLRQHLLGCPSCAQHVTRLRGGVFPELPRAMLMPGRGEVRWWASMATWPRLQGALSLWSSRLALTGIVCLGLMALSLGAMHLLLVAHRDQLKALHATWQQEHVQQAAAYQQHLEALLAAHRDQIVAALAARQLPQALREDTSQQQESGGTRTTQGEARGLPDGQTVGIRMTIQGHAVFSS